MARDGVGGCVGGGCGGLSLIGLLVGVGLTFWLGSIAMSGGFGGHDKKSDERSAVSEILATSTTVKPTASITVTPAAGLADGGTVIVSSSSFPASTKVTVSSCLGRATLATGQASLCDDTTVVTGTADANGHLNTAYTLHRSITVNGVPFDCADKEGECVLTATSATDATKHGTAPLAFAPTTHGPEITLPD